MVFRHKERQTTKLYVVRHLDTAARQNRNYLDTHPDNITILDILAKPTLTPEDRVALRKHGEALFDPTKPHPMDPLLPILPSEVPMGNLLGQRFVEKFGMPQRWERSNFLRAEQTSDAMRAGIERLAGIGKLPRIIVNRRLREKDHGISSIYPSKSVYFALNQDELDKYRKNPDKYKFKKGESERGFRRRMGIQFFLEQWAPWYEGKSTVLVTHSLVAQEHLRHYVDPQANNRNIWTGTVAEYEADPRKFWQPRRYHLVGPSAQKLIPYDADLKVKPTV